MLISAGYDAHAARPARGLPGDRRRATRRWSAACGGVAEELGVPVGLVLEGGYDLGALAESLAASLAVLGADEAPPAPEVELHPLARRARERLAARWPALVG